MATLPKRVKVAHYSIPITPLSPELAKDLGRFGDFDGHKYVIRMEKGITDDKTRDVLLHELLHAAYWIYGLKDEDEEERIVTVLTTAMLTMMRDNPKLVNFLTEK